MKELEVLIEEELARFRIPGTSVAVVKDGEVLLARGFGYRDTKQKLPVSDQTLFPIGSTTKAFTATVIGSLVDEGLVEWDRPVREYLPGFELNDPFATQALTLRDMLSHRSGLPRHDLMLLMYGSGALTRAEFVQRLRHLPLSKTFRQTWQYNNLLYMTAGYLVEVLTGDTWEVAVQKRLLEPLGMTNTNFSVTETQKSPDHSRPYSEKDGAIVDVPYRGIDIVGPAGSINSCSADLARWLRLNAEQGRVEGGEIVSEHALREIHEPVSVLPSEQLPWDEVNVVGYALGWMVEDFRGHRVISHDGGIDGFETTVSFIPKQRVGVAVLSNRLPSFFPGAIAYRIYEQLLDVSPLPWGERYHERLETFLAGSRETRERRRVGSKGTPPTHPLEDFAGSYVHPGYGRISFAVDEGQLVADLHDMDVTLEHRHYNVWEGFEYSLEVSVPFAFLTDFDGEIAKVEAVLEPTVDAIVFEKEPDPALSDPSFLRSLEGKYEFGSYTLEVDLQGSSLWATTPLFGTVQLVPRLGSRFDAKDHPEVRFEFVLNDEQKVREVVVEPLGVFAPVK